MAKKTATPKKTETAAKKPAARTAALELRPCRCGGHAVIGVTEPGVIMARLVCDKCGAATPYEIYAKKPTKLSDISAASKALWESGATRVRK